MKEETFSNCHKISNPALLSAQKTPANTQTVCVQFVAQSFPS